MVSREGEVARISIEEVIRPDMTERQLTEDMIIDRMLWRTRIKIED